MQTKEIMKNYPHVLIVAPSRKCKGGITTIIRQMEKTFIWKIFHCRWLQTQTNGNYFQKLFYFFSSTFIAFFSLPKYDIVHFHTVPGNSMIVQMPIFLWALVCRRKTIIHLHAGNQLDQHAASKLFKFILSHASEVVVLSDIWKTKISTLFPEIKSIKILYNPAPNVTFIPYDSRNGKYVIFIAYLMKNKGYKTLLEAYAMVCKKHPEWGLVIAGSGEVEEARRIAKNLDILERVDFTGWIDGEKKATMLANASCFCMASYMEGFPMSVLEAWAYGIPVLTTPVGGLPDVLEEGENALTFAPGNSEELSVQLDRIMQDNELVQKLILNGKKTVASKFDIQIVAGSWAETYKKIINQTPC